MHSKLSQASPITGDDEIVASNQPVNVYVANMYIDSNELTAMVSCNFLDQSSSQSRCMSP